MKSISHRRYFYYWYAFFRAVSRERMRERRVSRERSKERERRRSRSRHEESRTSPIKRSQSGRIIESQEASTAHFRGEKPKSLSFRVSPALEQQPVIITKKSTEKSAKYSETHFVASDVTHRSVEPVTQRSVDHETDRRSDRQSLPPPLPARKGRHRTSEPILYSSMPRMQLGGLGDNASPETEVRKAAKSVLFLVVRPLRGWLGLGVGTRRSFR